MQPPFNHYADSVSSFFSQAGRGFYVPYYQRQYSWDSENAKQLIGDIFSAVKRTLKKPNNTVFLGTVILHDERNVRVGVHQDTPNLLTRISNVVDGQQRITSLALLACVFRDCVNTLIGELRSIGSSINEFDNLADELANEAVALEEIFSVEVKKVGVSPARKPLIIRAGDVASNPASDQWTLKGDPDAFYRSKTAHVLARAIQGVPIESLELDERLQDVVDAFIEEIDLVLESADEGLAELLFRANGTTDCTLANFTGYPPDLDVVRALGADQQSVFYGALFMLAASNFLRNGCRFVVIECLDEGLAFDMFQSLNATGTPLTAFEVFKPTLVQGWGSGYPGEVKREVDRIERVFDTESSANRKEEVTDRVIVSAALVYDGSVLPKRFSEERDWLQEAMPQPPRSEAAVFVRHLADQAEYFDNFIRPRKPKKESQNFTLVTHLHNLGMQLEDAELAALCVFFLRDAQHLMAHSVLSVFYSKLLRARGTPQLPAAALEFLEACKATAAFFTLWMGAGRGRFPDANYRELFDPARDNMSLKAGEANQKTTFLKAAFRAALAAQNIYDAEDRDSARTTWIAYARKTAWYQRKAVCRFGMFAAFHDAAPDLAAGNEGLLVDGMAGSAPLLSAKAWYAKEYEVIEHVATRDQPSKVNFPSFFDERIYPGDHSVVDRIGNLTLLSMPVNSSIYSEWPEKVFYYWSLTMPAVTVQGPEAEELMARLGVTKLPPSLSTLHSSSTYLPHLAPLALRGVKGLRWDAEFIERRSEQLCRRIFERLDGWLR